MFVQVTSCPDINTASVSYYADAECSVFVTTSSLSQTCTATGGGQSTQGLCGAAPGPTPSSSPMSPNALQLQSAAYTDASCSGMPVQIVTVIGECNKRNSCRRSKSCRLRYTVTGTGTVLFVTIVCRFEQQVVVTDILPAHGQTLCCRKWLPTLTNGRGKLPEGELLPFRHFSHRGHVF